MSKIAVCVDITIPYTAPTLTQIYEAEGNLINIKRECEYWVGNIPTSFFAPYEVAKTRIRLRLAEIASNLQYELGIAVTEDLTGKPEDYQLATIQKAKSVVETARYCGSPLNVISGCIPHGHDQTTIDVLAGLGIPKCIGGNFPTESIPLSDKAAKGAGMSAADWLNMLKSAVMSGEDLVIVLDSYVSGNGDWLAAFKAFIPFAKANGGVFVLSKDA